MQHDKIMRRYIEEHDSMYREEAVGLRTTNPESIIQYC